MNFHESESYLLSLGNEVETMKLGLENIRILLKNLGKPSVKIPKIQVAGTNGKGSVCAFLNAICLSAGIKTGLYTSPHLVSITERISINGEEIKKARFAGIASAVRHISESLVAEGLLTTVPTYFEQVTAIALIAFANEDVDLIILETGLGGRYDATTAANAGIVAITPIDYDHQEYLGNTLAKIAAEKAAIIHEGSRVVVASQSNEAGEVIDASLDGLSVVPKRTEHVRTARVGGRTTFETEKAEYEVEQLGLVGGHQIENATVAILLAEILQDNFAISAENIKRGLENARHPGRLEYQGRFLFDGAHNIGGAKALREYLDEFVDPPITMIFAAMKDKEVGEIAQILFPKADRLILTKPENSRALDPQDLFRQLPMDLDDGGVFITNTVADALSKAGEVTSNDGLILVTGSLYLIGEVKKLLKQR